MAWKTVEPMEERKRFVIEARRGEEAFSTLCRRYGISRKTGYALMKRYHEEGIKGVASRSRRPHRSPQALSVSVVLEIIRMRSGRPSWGAKKLQKLLQGHHREVPSVRSINRVLDRAGLQKKRRRRSRVPYYPEQVIRPREVNEVWTIDFKGYWLTQDGKRCVPLTIRDEYSKYILDIGALSEGSTEMVKERLKSCFMRYGLPRYIRSDNGAPFSAYAAPRGVSGLAAWFIMQGVLPNRIAKGCPQQNGAHERMHLDMKRELQANPARDLSTQQRIFDEWRKDYNNLRPHEALNQETPASVYKKSSRRFSSRAVEYQYPQSIHARRVGYRGEIFWKGLRYFLSNALTRETVGLEPQRDGTVSIWFREFHLGRAGFDSAPLCSGAEKEKLSKRMLPMSWH